MPTIGEQRCLKSSGNGIVVRAATLLVLAITPEEMVLMRKSARNLCEFCKTSIPVPGIHSPYRT